MRRFPLVSSSARVIPCLEASEQDLADVRPGRIDPRAGRAAFEFLTAAADLALANGYDWFRVVDRQVRQTGYGGASIGLGIGGLLVMLILSWATGIDFLSLVGNGGGAPSETVGTSGAGPVASTPEEEKLVDFVDAVVGDAQATWGQLLGNRYQATKVRLFRDAIQSSCGFAEAASGPFYCPGDHLIYLDLGFFDELAPEAPLMGFARTVPVPAEPAWLMRAAQLEAGVAACLSVAAP